MAVKHGPKAEIRSQIFAASRFQMVAKNPEKCAHIQISPSTGNGRRKTVQGTKLRLLPTWFLTSFIFLKVGRPGS